jgi:hypothetical protein
MPLKIICQPAEYSGYPRVANLGGKAATSFQYSRQGF